MIVLGFDPGIANCGWAALEGSMNLGFLDCGVFVTKKTAAKTKTLDSIQRAEDIIERVAELVGKFDPKVMVAEGYQIFRMSHRQEGGEVSAVNTGRMLGGLQTVAGIRGVHWFEYSTFAIKAAVLGHGKGDKAAVQDAVCAKLDLKRRPNRHACDAIAAALCWWEKHRQGELGAA